MILKDDQSLSRNKGKQEYAKEDMKFLLCSKDKVISIVYMCIYIYVQDIQSMHSSTLFPQSADSNHKTKKKEKRVLRQYGEISQFFGFSLTVLN